MPPFFEGRGTAPAVEGLEMFGKRTRMGRKKN